MASMAAQSSALQGMEDEIIAGRREMQAGGYKAAIKAFRRGIAACICANHTAASSKEPQHGLLADCLFRVIVFGAVPAAMGSVYKAAKAPCLCGKRKITCSQTLHLEALDKSAACYSALGFNREAAWLAAAIIHVAPESPMGYCRLSKVLRTGTAKGKTTCTLPDHTPVLDPISIAIAIVRQGVHNVQLYGDTQDRLYKVLQVINFNMTRSDPLKKFSNELKVMIFSHLSTSDIWSVSALVQQLFDHGRVLTCMMNSTCMRVSKGWQLALKHDRRLWAEVQLGQINYAPSNSTFAQLLRCARYATSLRVQDARRLGLNRAKLMLIFKYLPDLNHLHLCGPPGPYQLDTSPTSPYPARLKSLTLSGIVAQGNERLILNLLHHSRNTLESVTLIGTSTYVQVHFPDLIPNLKVLRLEGSADGSTLGHIHNMDLLIESTPNLEQLYLNFYILRFKPTPLPPTQHRWSQIRVLVLGHNVHITPRESGIRCWPEIPREIRSIEILSDCPVVTTHVLWGIDDGENIPIGRWEKLRVFRCRSAIEYARLDEVVRPSFQSGNLRVLDVSASRPSLGLQDLAQPNEIALNPPEFSLTSDKVHTLGLSNFIFEDPLNYAALFTARPFLDWLSKFPSVDTVAAYPSAYLRCTDVIRALLFHKGIKRIFQDCLAGVDRDEVMKVARQKGIEVIHHKKFMPPTFPQDLTRDD